MRLITTMAAFALLAAGSAHAAPALELRLCPAKALHALPLAPGTRFQSLVVPNVALANMGGGEATLSEVTFDLLDKGAVVDTRRLAGDALRAAVKGGAAVEPQLGIFGFQFCDGKLLGEHPKFATTDALGAGTVALVANQTFGWKGSRDTLRITAHATRGGKAEEAQVSIPVDASTVKTPMRFPLEGRWAVVVAGTPHGGHRWALPEAFAYDIAAFGADDKSFRGDGQRFEDYYAYGAPVLAAGDGVVVEVVADQPELLEALRRPGESFDAYGDRMGALQMKLISQGERAIGGNAVIIDHGNGEYSLYAHLKPGSIPVKTGDRVKAGQRIGALGASGNVTEPHLHFQVCDAASPLHCAGIPLSFTNVELPYADGPRAIQAGDIVVAH
ncbi:MAG TPA: M23 family metallopeptidase [Phenylobacterium sp.]|nr:M23 family metallopeptidase [Phenylobacterium sp.]